jgi:hypothetical protein
MKHEYTELVKWQGQEIADVLEKKTPFSMAFFHNKFEMDCPKISEGLYVHKKISLLSNLFCL